MKPCFFFFFFFFLRRFSPFVAPLRGEKFRFSRAAAGRQWVAQQISGISLDLEEASSKCSKSPGERKESYAMAPWVHSKKVRDGPLKEGMGYFFSSEVPTWAYMCGRVSKGQMVLLLSKGRWRIERETPSRKLVCGDPPVLILEVWFWVQHVCTRLGCDPLWRSDKSLGELRKPRHGDKSHVRKASEVCIANLTDVRPWD